MGILGTGDNVSQERRYDGGRGGRADRRSNGILCARRYNFTTQVDRLAIGAIAPPFKA